MPSSAQAQSQAQLKLSSIISALSTQPATHPRPPAHDAVTPKNLSFQNINSIIYSDFLWLLECLEHELKVKIKFPVCYCSTGK